VNPQGTYRHRVPTLTLMGLALHGPAWAGGPHTHTPTPTRVEASGTGSDQILSTVYRNVT
jgi:hypothetical protein